MTEAMALSRDWGMLKAREALALPGSISEGAAKQLPVNVEVLIRTTHGLLEDCILAAIQKRSAVDFSAFVNDAFPQYFHAVLGLASLVKLVVPKHVIERIGREFYCELESDFREKGLACFGVAVRDQALFTAWTLRKISDILAQFPANPPYLQPEDAATASELANHIQVHAIRTRFHLHCLLAAMRVNQAIYPEPLELIIDGLRSAVNTYAMARRCLDIVSPSPETSPEAVEWDDEDAALLAESSREMFAGEIV